MEPRRLQGREGCGTYFHLVTQDDLPEKGTLENLTEEEKPWELWGRGMANARTQSSNLLISQMRKQRLQKEAWLHKDSQSQGWNSICQTHTLWNFLDQFPNWPDCSKCSWTWKRGTRISKQAERQPVKGTWRASQHVGESRPLTPESSIRRTFLCEGETSCFSEIQWLEERKTKQNKTFHDFLIPAIRFAGITNYFQITNGLNDSDINLIKQQWFIIPCPSWVLVILL